MLLNDIRLLPMSTQSAPLDGYIVTNILDIFVFDGNDGNHNSADPKTGRLTEMAVAPVVTSTDLYVGQTLSAHAGSND